MICHEGTNILRQKKKRTIKVLVPSITRQCQVVAAYEIFRKKGPHVGRGLGRGYHWSTASSIAPISLEMLLSTYAAKFSVLILSILFRQFRNVLKAWVYWRINLQYFDVSDTDITRIISCLFYPDFDLFRNVQSMCRKVLTFNIQVNYWITSIKMKHSDVCNYSSYINNYTDKSYYIEKLSSLKTPTDIDLGFCCANLI